MSILQFAQSVLEDRELEEQRINKENRALEDAINAFRTRVLCLLPNLQACPLQHVSGDALEFTFTHTTISVMRQDQHLIHVRVHLVPDELPQFVLSGAVVDGRSAYEEDFALQRFMEILINMSHSTWIEAFIKKHAGWRAPTQKKPGPGF